MTITSLKNLIFIFKYLIVTEWVFFKDSCQIENEKKMYLIKSRFFFFNNHVLAMYVYLLGFVFTIKEHNTITTSN